MKKKTDQDTLMTQYLLGDLAEEEQLRLEEQFFTDEEGYQQLLALEDELKYEYAQGGLTPEQRKSFEKRFLASAEDREKMALAGAVLAKAYEVSAQRTAAAAPVRAGQPGWWQSLAGFFTPRAPAMRFSLAAAAAAMLVVGSWSVYQTVQLRGRLEFLEAQRRSQEQNAQNARQELAQERNRRADLERQLAKRQEPATFLSFILAPGLVRDSEGQKPLLIPADAGTVRLQLDVKPKGVYQSYRAELQTVDGKRIWSQDVPSLTLSLPARLLPQDDYVIALKGITAHGELEDAGEYYFVVVRK
jgi:hypothetical protein